jgi:hypothetical protein
MSNNLLIVAGIIVLVVLYYMSTAKSSKSTKSVSPVSASASATASSPKKEKFSYPDISEGMENMSLDIDGIEGFTAKVGSDAATSSPKPESVIRSAKLGNNFGGGKFSTGLKGSSGAVGPNTTNVNGLGLGEGVPDFTLGVTPVISQEKKSKKLTAKDLLPKESKDDWFDMPYDKKQMMRIENENLLAGASTQSRIGIDTQGQTLKNASYDLRACPPNPKFNIGPWLISTIEPDYNIKPIM